MTDAQGNFNIFQISKPPSFGPGWDSNVPLSLRSLGPECSGTSLFVFLVNFTKFTTIEIRT